MSQSEPKPRMTATPCVCPPHHWLLSPPDGPTSVGVCLKCGDQREFNNWVPEYVLGEGESVVHARRMRGIRNHATRRTKEAAALLDERPPGWGRFD